MKGWKSNLDSVDMNKYSMTTRTCPLISNSLITKPCVPGLASNPFQQWLPKPTAVLIFRSWVSKKPHCQSLSCLKDEGH